MEDDEERWELRPRRGRRFHLASSALRAAAWAPVEAVLAWLTAASATAPFADLSAYPWLPQDWSAVHTTTLFGALTVSWTAVGVRIARGALRGGHPEVVVLNHRGIRTERLSGSAPRPVVDIPWDEVRWAQQIWHHLVVHGTRGTTVIATAGDDRQLEAIELHVGRRLAGRDRFRPPVLPGWLAYLDDRGATLLQVRNTGRRDAAAAAGGSLLCGANAVALAVDPPPLPGTWWGVALLGLGSVGLAASAFDHAERRWVARPGAVVLEPRGPGGGVAFEARSLEFVENTGEGVRYHLLAVAATDGRNNAARQEIMTGGELPDLMRAAGEWLSRHAEVPFHTRTTPQAR